MYYSLLFTIIINANIYLLRITNQVNTMIEDLIKGAIGALVGGSIVGTAANTLNDQANTINDTASQIMMKTSGLIVIAGFVYKIAGTFALV